MKAKNIIPLCCTIVGAILTLWSTNIKVAEANEPSTTDTSYDESSTDTELNNESTSNANLKVSIALRNLDDGTVTYDDNCELEAGKTYELIYTFGVVLVDNQPCKCQAVYHLCDYCDYDEICYYCDCGNISKVAKDAHTKIILPEVVWANQTTETKGIFWGKGARQEITSHTAHLTANTSLYLKPTSEQTENIVDATSATGFYVWKVRPDSPVNFSYTFTAEKISIFNSSSVWYFVGKIFSGQGCWNITVTLLILLFISIAVTGGKRMIRVLKARHKLRRRKRRKSRKSRRSPKFKIENLDDKT